MARGQVEQMNVDVPKSLAQFTICRHCGSH
jgi:hypothetical protein